ncbi:MAG: RNA polymerase sigma factor [Ruminococcaceae bacterium]|nr:RNA polymerase sigma factor [Oscillospiraceae bacterium]
MMDELRAIAQAKKGGADAFACLVETYETSVYRLALRMCGNAHDAEEVAQEAFVAAWKGLPSFRGESKFSSWLYQLTTNAAIDFLRREKRHRAAVPIEDEPEPATPDTPQQAVEADEVRRALQQALDALTPEHRQIFLLRQMRQLSYEEIGRLLGLEAGTVKSRLSRAKKQLRENLTQKGNLFAPTSVLDRGEEEDHAL